MKRKPLIYGLVFVAAVALWAAFRLERLFVNAKVDEAMPSGLANASETVLASGSFHSVAHDSKGMASIYQLENGKRVLRFTDFQTSNGPDVHVYLVAANDASDSDTVTKLVSWNLVFSRAISAIRTMTYRPTLIWRCIVP
jgi:hypothetical protein